MTTTTGTAAKKVTWFEITEDWDKYDRGANLAGPFRTSEEALEWLETSEPTQNAAIWLRQNTAGACIAYRWNRVIRFPEIVK